ncbi:cold-shock protein [Paenibacillus cremeus]|uniref:Cold-shock protein n=1 Tax=Paenibacillus cremeus TaxID=2163881 RepID=A0A559KDS4_9BACL|nr:cold-shock protein [Paenibacillus cremeus]TVY10263.1 cold-shock protein [Paenibacillus cremeus]
MYFSKKTIEPVQQEETPVWSCSQDQCTCWMRANFSFEDESPQCPICQSVMVRNTKLLPLLSNHTKKA